MKNGRATDLLSLARGGALLWQHRGRVGQVHHRQRLKRGHERVQGVVFQARRKLHQPLLCCLGRDLTSLNWVGLGWIGLGWIGLVWIGLGWVGFDLTRPGDEKHGPRESQTLEHGSCTHTRVRQRSTMEDGQQRHGGMEALGKTRKSRGRDWTLVYTSEEVRVNCSNSTAKNSTCVTAINENTHRRRQGLDASEYLIPLIIKKKKNKTNFK